MTRSYSSVKEIFCGYQLGELTPTSPRGLLEYKTQLNWFPIISLFLSNLHQPDDKKSSVSCAGIPLISSGAMTCKILFLTHPFSLIISSNSLSPVKIIKHVSSILADNKGEKRNMSVIGRYFI